VATVSVTTLVVPLLGLLEPAVELVEEAGAEVSPELAAELEGIELDAGFEPLDVSVEPAVVVVEDVIVSVEPLVAGAVTLEPGVALEPELLYAVLVAGVLWQPARAIAAMASAARIGDWRVIEVSRNVRRG